MATVIGCDISRWQDNNSTARKVDFAQMRSAGAAFVVCKASQSNWRDEDFLDYWQAAKAAGMIRGAYHFLMWSMAGATQAQYYWSVLQNDPGELPPIVDFETNPGVITPDSAVTVLRDFLSEIERLSGRVPMIYTSKGFWKPIWNSTGYNFARHPLWVAHYTTSTTPLIPAAWTTYAIHQYTSSGDGRAYGVESLEIDLNRTTDTTLSALARLPVVTEPEGVPMYNGKPIGYLTEKEGWTNPAFGFIVGKAGASDGEPNPQLKPIELQAASEKKPFLALWDFHPQYYIEAQYVPDDAHWPPLSQDKPYLKCIEAIQNRAPKAVIIRVQNSINALDGNTISPFWLSYSAQVFCGRVADWLARNKPACRLIVATSYPFLSQYAPGIVNWVDRYAQMVTDNAPALDASYPLESQKPGYLGNNAFSLWQYRSNLVLSMMDQAALESWLHFTPGTVEPPVEPPVDPEPTPLDLAALQELVTVQGMKIDEILKFLDRVFK